MSAGKRLGVLEDLRLTFRRIALIGLMVVLIAIIGGGVMLSRIDLASTAAGYLSDKIGRKLTIASAKVKIGSPIRVELRGVGLANMAGGSQPEMISLGSLKADVTLRSLIAGPLVVTHLTLDGAQVLLENGPNDFPNWKFAPPTAHIVPKPEGRGILPTLLDAHFHNVEIDFRTSAGNLLRTRLDDVAVSAAAPDRPVSIEGDGSYNGIAVHATVRLPPFTRLHTKTRTFPVTFKLTSKTTSLAFDGNATDPLNADGLDGRMVLDAPNAQELLTIAGVTGQLNMPLILAGTFSRQGGAWRLKAGAGTLDGDALKADLGMQEATQPSQPDAITIDAGFAKLAVDRLSQPGAIKQTGAELSLMPDPAPGALLDLHIAADRVTYRTIEADRFDLKAKLAPGTLAVDQLAAEIAGGSVMAKLSIVNQGLKAAVDFDGALTGVDAAKLSKLIGWGQMPIGGPITGRVSGTMSGATLSEARVTNRIYGVVTMDGGTIDRQLVSLASTDIRSLFGGRSGSGRLFCMLVVLNVRDGKGGIAPFKIKTAEGTITGGGSYDARNDYIDVTIGTQSASTSIFALDVPVRISGPVTDFNVVPAFGASARHLSAAGNLGDLPPDMQATASSSACAGR